MGNPEEGSACKTHTEMSNRDIFHVELLSDHTVHEDTKRAAVTPTVMATTTDITSTDSSLVAFDAPTPSDSGGPDLDSSSFMENGLELAALLRDVQETEANFNEALQDLTVNLDITMSLMTIYQARILEQTDRLMTAAAASAQSNTNMGDTSILDDEDDYW